MAVIQTPKGRVIGLIPVKDQPKPEPIAEIEPVVEEPVVEPVAKKPGRPPKK